MTTPKLPKPAIETTAFSRDSSTKYYYTADQVREILESAAEQLETQHVWISYVAALKIVRTIKDQL